MDHPELIVDVASGPSKSSATPAPTTRSRTWLTIGLVLASAHLAVLCGIALFDDGRPSEDLLQTVPWLLLIALPAALAAAGFRRPATLPWAAGLSLPVALLSLAGATLPLLLPAILYMVAYAATSRSPIEAP